MRKILKNKSGITLVALVVTIIVLIILATISIGSLVGKKGIINQAKEAKKFHEEGVTREDQELNELLAEYNNSMSGSSFTNGTGGAGSGDANTTSPDTNTVDPDTPPTVNADGTTPPKITDDWMIPVKWNGTNWEKTTANDEEWYNYEEKKWANVVLGDSTFKTVNGKEVLDEDANYSMLVWIPRYAYRIKSMYHQGGTATTAGEIDIAFIDTNNTDKAGTKYTRDSKEQYPAASTNGAMNYFVVHPAFDYGGTKLPGFWVGKFESSNTEQEGEYNGTDKTMMIKANVPGWKGTSISNAFDICFNMNQTENIYKLPTDKNKVDPHLMKNDEWGAVAYLSKSKYGKETEEVYINNNGNYITGIAGNKANIAYGTSTTNKYNTVAGQKASTNGNITGIYDMSGGSEEYVAAYVNNSYITNTTKAQYKSGKSLVDAVAKYKNVYDVGSKDAYLNNYAVATPENGYYGDALYETSNNEDDGTAWYADYSGFPYSSNPFFIRSGDCGVKEEAGVFFVNGVSGIDTSGCRFPRGCACIVSITER